MISSVSYYGENFFESMFMNNESMLYCIQRREIGWTLNIYLFGLLLLELEEVKFYSSNTKCSDNVIVRIDNLKIMWCCCRCMIYKGFWGLYNTLHYFLVTLYSNVTCCLEARGHSSGRLFVWKLKKKKKKNTELNWSQMWLHAKISQNLTYSSHVWYSYSF